jgi:hypothetical protein
MLLALPAHAAQIALAENLLAEVELTTGWTVVYEPPEELVAELAEHIEHDLRDQGKEADPTQLLGIARGRLAANEAFVVHDSGAYLALDASPLDAGAKAPGAKELRRSAEYAGASLGGEEGVDAYRQQLGKTRVAGAQHAVRLEADYTQHSQPRKFIGIITFAAGHWLFLYYTDPLADPQTLPAMEAMLASLRLRPPAP